MEESREHQEFHVGLKAFIADAEKLLIVQDDEGLWELPGGRTEKTETHKPLQDILVREVREELGGNIQYEIGPIFHAWIRKPEHIRKKYVKENLQILLVGFQCKYLKGDITLSEEHTNFRWITKEEVSTLEFENTYKEAVEEYFKNI